MIGACQVDRLECSTTVLGLDSSSRWRSDLLAGRIIEPRCSELFGCVLPFEGTMREYLHGQVPECLCLTQLPDY